MRGTSPAPARQITAIVFVSLGALTVLIGCAILPRTVDDDASNFVESSFLQIFAGNVLVLSLYGIVAVVLAVVALIVALRMPSSRTSAAAVTVLGLVCVALALAALADNPASSQAGSGIWATVVGGLLVAASGLTLAIGTPSTA